MKSQLNNRKLFKKSGKFFHPTVATVLTVALVVVGRMVRTVLHEHLVLHIGTSFVFGDVQECATVELLAHGMRDAFSRCPIVLTVIVVLGELCTKAYTSLLYIFVLYM